MGYLLSLIFLATTYLGVDTVFGPLAPYHVEQVMAMFVVLASLAEIQNSALTKSYQMLATTGVAVAIFCSILIGRMWPSGALGGLMDFFPVMFAFVVACLHVKTMKRLQILVLLLFSISVFVIVRGKIDVRQAMAQEYGDQADSGALAKSDAELQAEENAYYVSQRNDQGVTIYRIRGQNFLNDPNDFGQFLVMLTPMMFLFWKRQNPVWNLAAVMIPSGVLLYGIFLTHSRGALMALMVMLIVAGRKKLGVVRSLMASALLYVAASALHFTGGREISSAGNDRSSLWGAGLGLFRQHPLFGVGLGAMPDHIGHTAHNSVIVCAAELGLMGLFFWAMLLYSSGLEVSRLASAVPPPEDFVPPQSSSFPYASASGESKGTSLEQFHHVGKVLLLSATGYIAAAWFLSRATNMSLFLLGGLIAAFYQEALDRGMVPPRIESGTLIVRNIAVTAGLLLLAYGATVGVNLSH